MNEQRNENFHAFVSQISVEYNRLRQLIYAATCMLEAVREDELAAKIEQEVEESQSRVAFAALGAFHQDNKPLQ